MTSKLPDEVIKVHEKTLKLLDGSKEQLQSHQEMLRRAVVRLSIAARRDDTQLNNVLDQIRLSVRNEIDLDQLSVDLDSLLVLIDHAENEGGYLPLSGDKDSSNEISDVNSFARDLAQILDLSFEVNQDADTDVLLNELAEKIKNHAVKESNDIPEQMQYSNDSRLLTELVNKLVLPARLQAEQQAISRSLENIDDDKHQCDEAVDDISKLVNNSIKAIELEKKELQVFIRKTTSQLEEIEEYVRQSRQDRIDTVSESSMLKDSVEANVDKIQSSVGDAAEINQLKNDVQGHLAEIRKSVEEHQKAEIERESMSKQGYAHIIGELARTQKETLMLKEQLQESKQKMLRDPLTGLPNRMAYEERINLEINRCKRNNENICVAMWDIDHFKKVNDTYGHEAGDRVLKLLAKIISTRVRKVDMFARIGGEEFVLLMPETSLDNALNLNDQLRNSLADSGFHYNGSPCDITASVGIAKIEDYDNSESVMRKADEALYTSKREGRNRCTIYASDS